jgi:hypothetical protein
MENAECEISLNIKATAKSLHPNFNALEIEKEKEIHT